MLGLYESRMLAVLGRSQTYQFLMLCVLPFVKKLVMYIMQCYVYRELRWEAFRVIAHRLRDGNITAQQWRMENDNNVASWELSCVKVVAECQGNYPWQTRKQYFQVMSCCRKVRVNH